MKQQLLSLSLLALAASATAQTLIVPSANAAVDGNSSTTWPFDVAAGRFLYTYDSSHFTGNGVNFPILITGIRWRANASTTTWNGGSFPVTLDLSTAPGDYTAMVTTFDSNHGPNRTQVFNGTMVIAPGSSTTGTPGPFHASLTFPPFQYDPTQGDLVIDTVHSGNVIANTPSLDAVTTAGVALARRVTTTTNPPPATGTLGTTDVANVLELTYTPASGLYAGFTANVTSGTSPLSVNFTDSSFSSDPLGITSWAWDFDGDNVTDSNVQNPTFVYTTCGTFNVSLTVTDSTHLPSTMTKTAYVSTDDITAGFTYSLLVAPNLFQFTDTSTPAATTWDWDFNGDNITDSTAQNPTWPMNICTANPVRLTVTRNCKTSTKTQSFFLSPAQLPTLLGGTAGGASYAGFFDISVTNPQGINLCGMDHNTGPAALGTPFTVNLYVTPGSYVGLNQTPAAWRLVGTGSGNAMGATVASPTPLAQPVFLPAGNYGILLEYVGFQPRYSNTGGTVPTSYGNADITLYAGAFQNNAFTGTLFGAGQRMWNGALHYDTASLAGTAGYGFFGAGCAGSLGVSTLTPSGRPQLGTTLTVTASNLPQSLAVMMIGFSNASSPFGPLPLDLTGLGAPGCFGRVSPDLTSLLIGAGNSATWSFSVPNAFAGLTLYHQALVLDPGINSLGAVISDAAALQFGL